MKLKKNKGEHAEVAAEAMNDIMFFLMLFFLIVSTLANPNVIKLAVPNSAKVNKELNKRQPLILQAEKNGDDVLYLIDGREIRKADLETRLGIEIKGVTDPLVVLRASEDLTIQDLVDVLSLGEKMQIKMVFSSPG